VTRAAEFIDWRSFKRIPGAREAILGEGEAVR
jgi:hypothetical protein